MCNQTFKPFKAYSKKEFCDLEKFFSESSLPHDKEGKCIFHSKELLWKRKNNFYSWLEKLLEAEPDKAKIDLRETHFISKTKHLEIDYLLQLVNTDFTNAFFHAVIFIGTESQETVVKGKMDFTGCSFYESVFVQNCIFKDNVSLGKNHSPDTHEIIDIQFDNCEFEKNFLYEDQTEHFEVCFSMYKCEFKENTHAHFENVYCKNGSFDLNSCSFKQFRMINSEINCGVIDFSEIAFYTGIFENVKLKGEANFNGIKVDKNLSFLGSPERRIFYGNTSFDIKEDDIKGIITFLHTNIFIIDEVHRRKLLDLSYTGTVNIEEGCIKYRLQTENIFIEADEENQNIIQELTRTFTTFMSSDVAYNIGVEILDRTKQGFNLFYFSDANISKDEFLSIFSHHQTELFQILTNYKNTIDNITDSKKKINYFMTRVSLLGALCKCSVQIALNLWKKEDTLSLLNSIMLKGQELLVEGDDFHENLKNINVNSVITSVTNNGIPSKIHIGGHVKHLFLIQNNHGDIKNYSS